MARGTSRNNDPRHGSIRRMGEMRDERQSQPFGGARGNWRAGDSAVRGGVRSKLQSTGAAAVAEKPAGEKPADAGKSPRPRAWGSAASARSAWASS